MISAWRNDDLVPLKRVLEAVGVSRATLYRAALSGIEGFPEPTIKRRRVYWRAKEIEAIERGLDGYQGRGEFDRRRRDKRQCTLTAYAALLDLKRATKGGLRRARPLREDSQSDFFGWAQPQQVPVSGARAVSPKPSIYMRARLKSRSLVAASGATADCGRGKQAVVPIFEDAEDLFA